MMITRMWCDFFAESAKRIVGSFAAMALAMAVLGGGAVAQGTSAAQQQHDLTPQDLDAFFDGLVPFAMQRGDLAGAVLAIVKDGKVVFAKGYGYSDLAKREQVNPDRTIFRAGSVSKLFTWTAVMQLVQAGKLDLDQDVNGYLDFKIPQKFGRPITMRNLMTHTAGFAEIGGGTVPGPRQLKPLRAYLVSHMPARIFPPGKIVAYSNYGATLAGYIVERLSGERFADYIAAHIFKPLQMEHSTFDQPVPAALAPDLANGYEALSHEKPVPFEFVEVAPAGALSTTGEDMAHFMIAELQGGSFDGGSILDPATVKLMHSPQSRMAPGMNGFDLGFYQEDRNGLRIIGHAGDTRVFHSDLHLLLDKNIGIFMSFNSGGTQGGATIARTAIFHAFLDRYFPYLQPAVKTVAYARRDAARVAGWYERSRRGEGVGRLIAALDETNVTAQPDGTIVVAGLRDFSGAPKRWREVGPLTYQEIGGQDRLDFVANAQGGIDYWITDARPPVELFQRVRGLRQLPFLEAMGGACLAVWLITIAIWIVGIFRRRAADGVKPSVLGSGFYIASRVGVAMLLALFAVHFVGLPPTPSNLMIFYATGVLAICGAVVVIAEAALRVVRGPGGWLVRVGEISLGVTAVYAIWAIAAFGLASFQFTV